MDRLPLTGQVTERCILYSALDAYVRHFSVSVVTDAVARMTETNMRAELVDAASVKA